MLPTKYSDDEARWTFKAKLAVNTLCNIQTCTTYPLKQVVAAVVAWDYEEFLEFTLSPFVEHMRWLRFHNYKTGVKREKRDFVMSNKEIRAKIKNRSSGSRESNIERLDINLVQ